MGTLYLEFDWHRNVCFFYFNSCNSGNEILYRVGNNLGTRQTFQSLCPNKLVREEVYGSSKTMLLYTCYKIVTTFKLVKFVIQCIADNTIHGFEGCLQPTLPHKECLVYATSLCGIPYFIWLLNRIQKWINLL